MHNPARKVLTCITLILCLLIFSGIATAASSVRISPPVQTVASEETFVLEILIEPEMPISGLHFDLTYDGDIVSVINVEDEHFFSGNDSAVMFNPGIINDSTGTVSGIYSSVIKGNSVADTGVFCTVNLKAGANPGTCQLGIRNLTIMGGQGNEIPAVASDSTVNIKDRAFASIIDEAEIGLKGLSSATSTRNGSIGWIVFILTATAFVALAYYFNKKE